MASEHHTERFLQQMRCAVVLTGCISSFRIYFQCNRISSLEHAGSHTADMSHLAAQKLHGLFYLESTVLTADNTDIAGLAAHRRIERRFIHKNRPDFAVRQCFHKFRLRRQNRNNRIVYKTIIADKFRSHTRVDGFIYGHVCTHIICNFAGFARLGLLLFHRRTEPFFVHAESFFFQNFLR